MLSVAGMQVQLAVSLGQFANVWQSARSATAGHVSQKVRQRHSQQAAKASFVSTNQEGELLEAQELQDSVKNCLSDLGLENLSESFKIEEITSPEVSPQLIQYGNRLHDNYVSSPTFFENKTGFSVQEIKAPTHRNVEQHFQVTLLNRKNRPQSVFSQLVRGFKTVRSTTSVGIGSQPEDVLPRRRLLKKPEFTVKLKRENDDAQKTPTLAAMLADKNVTPNMADKINVAFAEGYSAGNKGGSSGTHKSSMRIALFVVVIVALVAYSMVKKVTDPQKFGMLGMGGGYQAVNPEDLNVTFDDVKGCAEAKDELQDIVEFLKNPSKYQDLGAKLPKGVLLVGPPGTGKTLLARAVAGEASVPFIQASGSEFDEMFVGTGARKVRALFEMAKLRAPCLVFIDEIDSVGAKRTSSTFHPYANQTINQLLSEMDGFVANSGVIVLAATNRRNILDSALIRPGRFDVEVIVDKPDLRERIEILTYYMSKIVKATDVEIDIIAKSTIGCTGADLENIVNQAALKAVKEGDSKVTKEHLEYAMDKNLMGTEKKSKVPVEEVNWYTAYHEAGHALVAYYTPGAQQIRKVTIMPRGMSLGHTSFTSDNNQQYQKKKSELLAYLDVSMGGRVAEEIMYGPAKVSTGASHDFSVATDLATAMVKSYGMSDKVGVRFFNNDEVSTEQTKLIDTEIKRLLEESYERATTILKTHKNELCMLADALMKYESLDITEFEQVLKGKKIVKDVFPKKNNKNVKNNTIVGQQKDKLPQPNDPPVQTN